MLFGVNVFAGLVQIGMELLALFQGELAIGFELPFLLSNVPLLFFETFGLGLRELSRADALSDPLLLIALPGIDASIANACAIGANRGKPVRNNGERGGCELESAHECDGHGRNYFLG